MSALPRKRTRISAVVSPVCARSAHREFDQLAEPQREPHHALLFEQRSSAVNFDLDQRARV